MSGRLSALLLVAAVVLCVGIARPVRAQTAEGFRIPDLPVDTFSLSNGLRVVVSEDHSTPVVAVNMWYYVGSAHEEVGRSGFAHLFEHMFFEETEHLARGDMDRLVNRAGGIYNGTTNTDRTAYFEVLPANRVNLALWLHAERMARLRVSRENFENQRSVVKEERRMRIDNQPYAVAQLTVDTLAERDYPPYRHTVIGSMDDLDAASVADAQAFYQRYYAPNHAVLTVVGDVTVDEVRELAETYLGGIPRGPELPPLPAPPAIPRSDGERRAEIDAPLAQLPLLWMAFNLPPAGSPDHYALRLLSEIFSTGESSRLRQRLVDREQAALDVISQVDQRVGPGLILFGAIPNQGVGVDRLEALMQDEIQRLQQEGVSDRELDKAKNQVRAQAVTDRMTVQSKASLLQSLALYQGSPLAVNHELARYEEVTAADVRRVARTYLVPPNETVVVARPPTSAGGGEGGRP